MNLVKPEPVTTTGSITRSTVGTYFDIAGVMQTAAIDAIRINYDPLTHEFLGVLIENAATNLLTYSSQFDNAIWSAANLIKTANQVTAPDNTLSGDLLDPLAAGGGVSQNFTSIANSSHVVSIYVKAVPSYPIITNTRIRLYDATALVTLGEVRFSWVAGVPSILSLGGNATNVVIKNVGNSWYRLSFVSLNSANTASRLYIYPDENGGASDGRIYVWGAQVEAGTSVTSHIPTVASAVTRAADIITGSGLVYTNLTNAYAEWSSATTYALGTSVSYGTSGTYISLQNSNLNQNPLTAAAYWLRTGPTNKMAAFDDQISSVSSSSSDIIFAITASSIDTVALLNVTGSKTSIAVADSSLKTEIYHNAQQLTGGDSLDWYGYFFYDSDTVRTMSVYMDIPTASNILITVKVSGTGTISLGTFITGVMKTLGTTQYGVSAGIIDYSRKDTDEFGNVTFIKRNYSKRINASVSLTNSNLNKVQRQLYQIRATPVLWLASTDIQFEEPLITYGFYRDFSTEISYPTHSICNLQIEGLI